MGDSHNRTTWTFVFVLLAACVLGASLVGCGGDGDSSTTAGTPGCRRVEAAKPKRLFFKAPKQTVQKGEELTAVVETSCGTFDIALDAELAPKTVNSFVFLSEKNFYDGLTFERIEPGFMIQAGDPLGVGTVGGDGGGIGTGGPGYRVDEKPPSGFHYEKGTVGMLQRSPPLEPPGRSGSQFFVISAEGIHLSDIYAPLGKVSKGFDVVERIDALGTYTRSQKPKQPILIENITIQRG